jgi:hypothetical protein
MEIILTRNRPYRGKGQSHRTPEAMTAICQPHDSFLAGGQPNATSHAAGLPEGLDIRRMRQRVAGVETRNHFSIKPALAGRGFRYLLETSLGQDPVEFSDVKRGPLLAIAKDKVGELSSEGIDVPLKTRRAGFPRPSIRALAQAPVAAGIP